MRRPSHKNAFTLIELMITVLLLALLTSGVALSFNGTFKASRAQDAIEQLRSFDASTRMFAKRFDRPMHQNFDLSANTLSRLENANNATPSAQVSLPSGIWIDEMRIGSVVRADGELATVDVSPLGLSESYAVRLRGPDLDQWIVFAGLTGSMTEVQDESTMQTLITGGAKK